jgi:hypothetical protein
MPINETANSFTVLEFRAFERNTLRGFLSLQLPSGMVIRECCLHKKDEARWISPPARKWEKNGETGWTNLVDFDSKESRQRFQAAALQAIDEYLEGAGE